MSRGSLGLLAGLGLLACATRAEGGDAEDPVEATAAQTTPPEASAPPGSIAGRTLAGGHLLLPGIYVADDVPVTDGEEVLALCDGELRALPVQALLRADLTVDVDVACDATALFVDLAPLSAGKVKGATMTGRLSFEEKATLTLGRAAMALRALRTETGGYVVVVDVPGTTWTVASQPAASGGIPTVLWAGDLDGDRDIDLLLDAPATAEGHALQLLLSSPSTEGPLAQVASLRVGGG